MIIKVERVRRLVDLVSLLKLSMSLLSTLPLITSILASARPAIGAPEDLIWLEELSIEVPAHKKTLRSWDSAQGAPDPYFKVEINHMEVWVSKPQRDARLASAKPTPPLLVSGGETLTISVWDRDMMRDDLIGLFERSLSADLSTLFTQSSKARTSTLSLKSSSGILRLTFSLHPMVHLEEEDIIRDELGVRVDPRGATHIHTEEPSCRSAPSSPERSWTLKISSISPAQLKRKVNLFIQRYRVQMKAFKVQITACRSKMIAESLMGSFVLDSSPPERVHMSIKRSALGRMGPSLHHIQKRIDRMVCRALSSQSFSACLASSSFKE